jgi:heterokaryon incompatibility protein (HET)
MHYPCIGPVPFLESGLRSSGIVLSSEAGGKMWLLNAVTLELKEFTGNIPPYAILSHTWNQEEISFKDIRKRRADVQKSPGFKKIELCCLQAKKDWLEWVWIDSCSIDKRSSAELSEAINSMYKWYERADICYAYLEDMPPPSEDQPMLGSSRWFTRGWTLQELLAPGNIKFYSREWDLLGMKSSEDIDFCNRISCITGISVRILLDQSVLKHQSVAVRMSWAAKRQTTREEDKAYSLMGLFDVNMPIIYWRRSPWGI